MSLLISRRFSTTAGRRSRSWVSVRGSRPRCGRERWVSDILARGANGNPITDTDAGGLAGDRHHRGGRDAGYVAVHAGDCQPAGVGLEERGDGWRGVEHQRAAVADGPHDCGSRRASCRTMRRERRSCRSNRNWTRDSRSARGTRPAARWKVVPIRPPTVAAARSARPRKPRRSISRRGCSGSSIPSRA